MLTFEAVFLIITFMVLFSIAIFIFWYLLVISKDTRIF